MSDPRSTALSSDNGDLITRLGRPQRILWGISMFAAISIAAWVVFGVAGQTIVPGQNSDIAQRYTGYSEVKTPQQKDLDRDPTWGKAGGTSTLVLFDTAGNAGQRADAEVHAIQAGNLATHFGTVTAEPMADYTTGSIATFDAVIYVGSTESQDVPRAFVEDAIGSDVPVLWAGANIGDLAGGDAVVRRQFERAYGLDPSTSTNTGSQTVDGILYDGRRLTRDGAGSGPITVPNITGIGTVAILAETTQKPAKPWAIRSKNLTYVGEDPFNYVDESDRYLAFADLYYDLLAPKTVSLRQAAVRLEDVYAAADPDDLRSIADFLHSRDIVFQVAVIPFRISKSPDGGDPIGLSLKDKPKVRDALRYMQARGGTLIQHGTTHQYGLLDNPYNGSSGADFEFYRSRCSSTPQPPYAFEPCTNDSNVIETGPVPRDSVPQWTKRIEQGRDAMVAAGLGRPTIFETPHYAASANAYAAMSKIYVTRYERTVYFPGQLSGETFPADRAADQYFPFRVRDIYGTTVLPENLGNVTEAEQNNHAVRDPQFIIDGAKANLAVRESTASFFYHPFLGVDKLRTIVDGIEGLGYTFVPAAELK